MPLYNVLIGCDQKYFDEWGIALLNSIKRNAPFLSLHCHIVNPNKENNLESVSITSEQIEFTNDNSKISYLQSARFIAVANKFSQNENVITLDADSICTRTFNKTEFEELFKKQYVLKHHKENRWLAGFVTFNDNGFRQEYAKELNNISVDEWQWGRDQLILNKLKDDFSFTMLPRDWMAIGKNKSNSAFLTLKGEQKTTDKYLKWYNRYIS
tara:strand:- start:759 stop:1394 length:636 start_codon:yes stop_codon:yes gene_type:complete